MEVKRWHVGVGSVVVTGGGLGLFLYYRFAVRGQVEKAILDYYNSNKLLIGPLLYFSQTGSFKIAVEGSTIRKLAQQIATREVPLWSFSIPNKAALIEEIANDALVKASENPQVKRLANQALDDLK